MIQKKHLLLIGVISVIMFGVVAIFTGVIKFGRIIFFVLTLLLCIAFFDSINKKNSQ